MKVFLNKLGENGALAHHIEKEGDEVVEDRKLADCAVQDSLSLPVKFVESLQIGRGVGGILNVNRKSVLSVCSIFDGTSFLPQFFCLIPLHGIMDEGLGASVSAGCVICYIEPNEVVRRYFESEKLCITLHESHYSGVVSVKLNSDLLVLDMSLGLDNYGYCAILEGVNRKISDLLTNPTNLKESWGVALLLSRFPYPSVKLQDDGNAKIGIHIAPNVERHLWLFKDKGSEMFRQTFLTSSTRVGVVSAWSTTGLYNAVSRAYQTLDHIELPEKQHRTDVAQHVKNTLRPFLGAGLFTLQVRPWFEKDLAATKFGE